MLCAVCLFALCPSVAASDGSDTPDAFPSLPRGAYRSGTAACWPLPAPLSRARAYGIPPPARSVCGSRRGRRRPVALPCALPARLPGPSAATGPACFLNGAEAMRRPCPCILKLGIRPGDGSPQTWPPRDTLSFKGVYLSCSGSMRRLPYRSYPFVAAYFYNWVKLPTANPKLDEVGALIREGRRSPSSGGNTVCWGFSPSS